MDMFWSEKFWFPEGVTWLDLRNDDPNIYIPQIEDIGLLSMFIGLVLLIIRFLSERYVFRISSSHRILVCNVKCNACIKLFVGYNLKLKYLELSFNILF